MLGEQAAQLHTADLYDARPLPSIPVALRPAGHLAPGWLSLTSNSDARVARILRIFQIQHMLWTSSEDAPPRQGHWVQLLVPLNADFSPTAPQLHHACTQKSSVIAKAGDSSSKCNSFHTNNNHPVVCFTFLSC